MSAMHKLLAKQMSEIICEPDKTPKWLAEGITYLLAKTSETTNAKNFRPITFLSTTYKILTSVLTEKMYGVMEANKLFPLEQNGCKRGSYGFKDQLLINRMLMENCQKSHRNLSMAWIDYRKAFDSIPHGWILRAFDTFKLSPTIIRFLQHNMRLWNANLRLNHANGITKTNSLRIKCGIFQRDSLSPLLFCISLIPLSIGLNHAGYGYQIMGKSINHLFYMDDLKLFARNDSELTGLLDTVKHFCDDIGMQFGLDKCAKATFTKGKIVKTENIILDVSNSINEMEHERMYKYLGIQEAEGVASAANEEKVRKKFYRGVKTELNARNKIMPVNSLAMPIVIYGFNILYWTMPEIKRLDVRVRKLLTINKIHHSKADVDKLYIRRSDGGKGLSGENVGKAYKSGKSMGIIFRLEFAIITLLSCLLLLAIALKSLDSQHPCSKMGMATKVLALNACTPVKSSQAVVVETPLWLWKSQGKVWDICFSFPVATMQMYRYFCIRVKYL